MTFEYFRKWREESLPAVSSVGDRNRKPSNLHSRTIEQTGEEGGGGGGGRQSIGTFLNDFSPLLSLLGKQQNRLPRLQYSAVFFYKGTKKPLPFFYRRENTHNAIVEFPNA